jgi:hypothetical protein
MKLKLNLFRMHTHIGQDHRWFGSQIIRILVRLPPSYNAVSTPAPRDILGPIFDYFADFYTGMGPNMSLKVCFTGIWTEIHEQVSSLVLILCLWSLQSLISVMTTGARLLSTTNYTTYGTYIL